MSLRQLWWMAAGRRRDEWDRVAALMAFVASRVTGETIDPTRLNPYRGTRPPRTPEQTARENRDGWRLLETGLRQVSRG